MLVVRHAPSKVIHDSSDFEVLLGILYLYLQLRSQKYSMTCFL